MYMYEMIEYLRRMPKLSNATKWKQTKIQWLINFRHKRFYSNKTY